MNPAAHRAISAATPMDTAPGPSNSCTTMPTPIPSVTPIIIWIARCARSTLAIDRDTAAAIGAENGSGCPSRWGAMYRDRPAATEVCTRLTHTARSRLRPARAAETAEAHDGTVRRVVLTGLHRLQLEQRNHPAGLGLVFGEARRRGGDLFEERVALGGRQLAGGHVERVGADLHLCPRVGPQVVHPGRVEGGAGERSDDDQLAVVAEIRQRRHPGLARFGPRRRQQQQIRVGELAAHLAFVGPEVVDDALVERVDGL